MKSLISLFIQSICLPEDYIIHIKFGRINVPCEDPYLTHIFKAYIRLKPSSLQTTGEKSQFKLQRYGSCEKIIIVNLLNR